MMYPCRRPKRKKTLSSSEKCHGKRVREIRQINILENILQYSIVTLVEDKNYQTVQSGIEYNVECLESKSSSSCENKSIN